MSEANKERRRIRILQRAALLQLKCITCDCEEIFDEGHGDECTVPTIKRAIAAMDQVTRAPRRNRDARRKGS